MATQQQQVRQQILALLAQEPQTDAISRQVNFLERDLARLEASQPTGGGQDVLQEFCNSVLSLKYTDRYSGKSVPLYKSLDERVVNTLATKYASELMVCRKVPKIAGDLYKMIKELPKTSTVFQFETAANLKLNGPLSSKKANIMSATGVDGRMLMVKILLIDPDCQLPVDIRKTQLKFEAEICKELQMFNSQLSIVPTEVYHVSHPHHSTYHTDLTGLVMPRYVSTVSDSPSFFPLPIVKGLERVASALDFLHQWQIHEGVEGLVHMDVKGCNIFVDVSGAWFLGDFGSTRPVDSHVVSTTESFYPVARRSEFAKREQDWYMLLVVGLIESMNSKDEWHDHLCDDPDVRIVSDKKVQALANKLMGGELRAIISYLMLKAEV